VSAPASKRGRAERPVEASTLESRVVVGTLVAFERGQALVSFSGAPRPVVARALSGLDDETLKQAAEERADALLLFEEGDAARPVLVGTLRSPAPLVEALLAAPLPAEEKVARVDGKRVVIEGKEEVVLQCGKASLTLRKDGRVVLRGVNVISQADQVHKIRGGKVQVN
jgi:hypothetical protein